MAYSQTSLLYVKLFKKGSCPQQFTMLCSVLCEDEKQAVAVKSQLQQLARPMYSNPPVHGAVIVSTILGDPELKKLWLKEVKVH